MMGSYHQGELQFSLKPPPYQFTSFSPLPNPSCIVAIVSCELDAWPLPPQWVSSTFATGIGSSTATSVWDGCLSAILKRRALPDLDESVKHIICIHTPALSGIRHFTKEKHETYHTRKSYLP